ncbi:hypothetical protein K474DRAFT_1660319 [Panus rudis PR-1116 ss-1]|nr:hypothetical protein K474DRAFT_1660319 [Panus rudis PR-1116 ss-1]
MAISEEQKRDIRAILALIFSATNQRKRRLADMFLDLVDKNAYPEYYEIIPEPRCLNGVKGKLDKNLYRDPLEVYEDLNLVFLNALYYNAEGSTVNRDAKTLKGILDEEWKRRESLPTPRASPPPSSAQKTHPIASSSSTVKSATDSARARPKGDRMSALPPSGERASTPEVEVDVGGTPEPDAVPHEVARDGESDAIVRQLERGLPRWEGFADVGWADDIAPDRRAAIVQALVEYQDASGNRIASALESLPEETNIPEVPYTTPLSLAAIQTKARNKSYESSQAFDKELACLFLKGRRSYEPCSELYGHVLELQRLYHALTSPTPPQGPPYSSPRHFASLKAGPGSVKPLHSLDAEGVSGVTMLRVPTRDRVFVDELHYKGWSVRLADWLHLSNPDDPSRPIVAQIFKCWVSEEPSKKGQSGVTVCWYYRPEQTFHPGHRQFWENEVFKTGHFADHPLEDIIEKIACQFTARHVRGRPRPPYWYPGWPLYVCDSRYNDNERVFVKIKNWNSCVPEEVRKSAEFMPIYPFERMVWPKSLPSPFLRNKINAPGGIIDDEPEQTEADGHHRKRHKRSNQQAGASPNVTSLDSTVATQNGATATHPQVLYDQGYGQHAQQDRSLVTATGLAGANVSVETLPSESTKHFDHDPLTNEMLWFAAPPIDIPHIPPPEYSLQYLHFLARRKNQSL